MKHRTDFVTNSSSASFIIQRADITDPQLFLIVNYRELSQQLGLDYDYWNIDYDDESVSGFTTMENEDMMYLLTKHIGISRHVIEWGD